MNKNAFFFWFVGLIWIVVSFLDANRSPADQIKFPRRGMPPWKMKAGPPSLGRFNFRELSRDATFESEAEPLAI